MVSTRTWSASAITKSDRRDGRLYRSNYAVFIRALFNSAIAQFESSSGESGYLIEPRHPLQKVIQPSGVSFTLHDLRRTFFTIAESFDISAYALKRLVNHKMTNDVTTGYIVSDVER